MQFSQIFGVFLIDFGFLGGVAEDLFALGVVCFALGVFSSLGVLAKAFFALGVFLCGLGVLPAIGVLAEALLLGRIFP